MRTYVVMGNDFPEAVFSERNTAEKFCELKRKENTVHRIYWQVYDFKLDAEINQLMD